ncbi:hypothetical protein [Streptomyces nanshensis]|uniref:Uncharacterized protein n=1 Tax=Streptomyces nanshensis TaxID=518642 RepID=A0A1E7KVB8_9ACTN|nr:hypothetical protein [Streptomyces nanshensis]OEV07871.1 hypothetical protein AN218_28450 [Streptomyces nanshensis]
MGHTSFIVQTGADDDVLTAPRTQFAELTGAYWLEPIYAGLAHEWNRQGRTVPGTSRERRRVLPDGSLEPEPPDGTGPADVAEAADSADATAGSGASEEQAERAARAERAERSGRGSGAALRALPAATDVPG